MSSKRFVFLVLEDDQYSLHQSERLHRTKHLLGVVIFNSIRAKLFEAGLSETTFDFHQVFLPIDAD